MLSPAPLSTMMLPDLYKIQTISADRDKVMLGNNSY